MGTDPEATRRRVTRDVDAEQVRDLLVKPPRATLAFAAGADIEVVPVAARFENGRHFIVASAEAAAMLPPDGDAVLVIDAGWYWFDLRGISLRGRLVRVTAPADGGVVFELLPRKVLAWDYGTIREE